MGQKLKSLYMSKLIFLYATNFTIFIYMLKNILLSLWVKLPNFIYHVNFKNIFQFPLVTKIIIFYYTQNTNYNFTLYPKSILSTLSTNHTFQPIFISPTTPPTYISTTIPFAWGYALSNQPTLNHYILLPPTAGG